MDSNEEHSFTTSKASNIKNEDTNSSVHENLLGVLKEGIQETTEENVAYERSIIEFLSTLQLEPKSLSNNTKEEFDKVSLILKAEGLPDINKTSLDIVKRRKNIQEMAKNILDKEMHMKISLFVLKAKSIRRKINYLQASIDNATDIIRKITKDTEDFFSQKVFMATKLTEYNQTLEKLETDLQHIQDLEPEVLLKKYKQYTDMTEQVVNLDQFLKQYNGLPPDLLQAKALLEDKQKEYEELQDTFL